ncbi:MAG: sirohydrochlorin cobaltochelatase [Oscillospiraceae bacterium]|nr:sirohydrochlorin cobaltochelatase [Oscillospiraceae bacterium]
MKNKNVLLAVSFGTSNHETRAATIGAIEDALQAAYPDYEVRRAFTSQIIIDKLRRRDDIHTDNVTTAMSKLAAEGVKRVVVQPTHVMSGIEYDEMLDCVKPYEHRFESVSYGSPLLTSDKDFIRVAELITKELPRNASRLSESGENSGSTAYVFMGHGTEHSANSVYARLQNTLNAGGRSDCYIGTVEAVPSLDDVIKLVDASGVKRVVLLPLMIVAGDHACNDMAGDANGSWKTVFGKKGYEVECVLKGLGEYQGIREIFVEHAGEAIREDKR